MLPPTVAKQQYGFIESLQLLASQSPFATKQHGVVMQ